MIFYTGKFQLNTGFRTRPLSPTPNANVSHTQQIVYPILPPQTTRVSRSHPWPRAKPRAAPDSFLFLDRVVKIEPIKSSRRQPDVRFHVPQIKMSLDNRHPSNSITRCLPARPSSPAPGRPLSCPSPPALAPGVARAIAHHRLLLERALVGSGSLHHPGLH